jgi:putative Mn2+ efflux pump MntP
MLFPLLSAGLLLGLDSFVVCLGAGAVVESPARRRGLVLSFALCDGLASFVGWAAGAAQWWHSLAWCEWLGPVAVGAYGLSVLWLAWHSRRLAESGGWLVLGLPLCLSIDNLAAGMAAGSAGSAVLTAVAFGAASGCLALLGMHLGAAVAARARARAQWVGGAILLGFAFALLCKEALY